MVHSPVTLPILVELYGTPRLRTGRREVALELRPESSRKEVVLALAEACPELVGHAICHDLSDLDQGFVFNHSGRTFLTGDRFSFQPGDTLLLLSSQAGG
jgi:hypothetical protein